MKIKSTVKAGFTLVEIMIVVAIIGLLAAIAIPNFVKARTTAQKNACINNLRQIDGAVQQWALEQKKAADATIDATTFEGIVTEYLKNEVRCPAAGVGASLDTCYSATAVNVVPACKIVSDHTLMTAAPPAGS